MEAFSERLLREHQPAWQAMQQHPFVTDIEQDRRGQQSAGYSTAALADWRAECPGRYADRVV